MKRIDILLKSHRSGRFEEHTEVLIQNRIWSYSLQVMFINIIIK